MNYRQVRISMLLTVDIRNNYKILHHWKNYGEKSNTVACLLLLYTIVHQSLNEAIILRPCVHKSNIILFCRLLVQTLWPQMVLTKPQGRLGNSPADFLRATIKDDLRWRARNDVYVGQSAVALG